MAEQAGSKSEELKPPDLIPEKEAAKADILSVGNAIQSTVKSVARNAIATLVIFGIGITASLRFRDWNWFARSGAFVTAVELFIITGRMRVLLRSSFKEQVSRLMAGLATHLVDSSDSKEQNAYRVFDHGHRALKDSLAHEDHISQSMASNVGQYFESWILLVGTLVWGFGDLFNKLAR